MPAGEYRFYRHRIEAAMTQSRRMALGAEYIWGGIYDGGFRSLAASLSLRPSKHINLAADYELTRFDLPSGELDVHVGVIRSTIAVSPTMFIRSDIQYDNISENFTFLARFSFEPAPEREIFLSLGHTALIEEDRFPTSFRAQGTSLALRLGHTFRM